MDLGVEIDAVRVRGHYRPFKDQGPAMGSKCRTIQILVVLVVIEPGNYFLDSFNAFNVRLTRSVTSLSLIGKLIN